MTPYHGHSNNSPLLRAFFMNGFSPLAWPDSTERGSRLGAELQGGRGKEGWERNDGEGHTCFCGLRALMWRARPPRRVLFSQTAHRESGRWLGKHDIDGDGKTLVYIGCVLVAHFSSPLGSSPLQITTTGSQAPHLVRDLRLAASR